MRREQYFAMGQAYISVFGAVKHKLFFMSTLIHETIHIQQSWTNNFTAMQERKNMKVFQNTHFHECRNSQS